MNVYALFLDSGEIATSSDPQNPPWVAIDSNDPRLTYLPTPTLAQQKTFVVQAASAVCASITSAVAPDATHSNAYQIVAGILLSSGGSAPTTGPVATLLSGYASSLGETVDQLSARVTAGASAALNLSAALAVVESAASSAADVVTLSAAVTAFNSSISGIIASLVSVGIAVATPGLVTLPGA